MLFAIKPTCKNVLGQDLEIYPLSVTAMLKYRDAYIALKDDDAEGSFALMRRLIKECVKKPTIKDDDLEPLDRISLMELFDACSEVCGLSEKKTTTT